MLLLNVLKVLKPVKLETSHTGILPRAMSVLCVAD